MNDPTTKPALIIDPERDAIRTLSNADLFAALVQAIRDAHTARRRIAFMWCECESRGIDLSGLSARSIGKVYRRIADGSARPWVADLHDCGVSVVEAIAGLPLDQQDRLGSAGALPLAIRAGDGFTEQMIPLKELRPAHVQQAIGPDGLRGKAEQVAALIAAKPPRPPKPVAVMADRLTRTVSIGGRVAPAEDVARAMKKAGLI